MKKYHLNEKGQPKECAARPGKCPIGGDHYNSELEARKEYEKKMASKIVPSNLAENQTLNKNNSLRLARKSKDVNILQEIANEGKENNLQALASNENASKEVLLTAMNHARNLPNYRSEKIIYEIEKNKNYPPELVSEKSMEKLKFVSNRTKQIMSNPKITDEQAMIALDNGYHVEVILASENNLSDKTIESLVESSSSNFRDYSGHSQYDLASRIDVGDNHYRSLLLAESSSNQKVLNILSEREDMHENISRNTRANVEILKKISELSNDENIHKQLYFNARSDDDIKERALKYSEEARAHKQLKHLEKESVIFDEMLDRTTRRPVGESHVEFRFPIDLVKEVNVEDKLEYVTKFFFRQPLKNTTYDPKTGIFVGERTTEV